jgi:predicted anti-sigma-YlaC factor YlaD
MTMKKGCKSIQEDLIDIFYDEKKMDNEIEMHLASCGECKAHWDSLHSLKADLFIPDTSAAVDIEGIAQAFQIAGELQKTHKARIDYIVFFLAVLSIMSVVVGIAAMGYGIAVIICQVSAALLTPIILPLLYLRRLGREES